MGNRVSVSFRNNWEESVTLFSHWGGMSFVKEAKKYAKSLANRKQTGVEGPLDRMEPQTVMVDFIRHITKDKKEVTGDLYLGHDENDGDNGDNGHHIIELKRG